MKALAPIMDRVTAYRLWQAPFSERKLQPVRRHNRIAAMRRVLDVGCGPGTNARHFLHADYLGVDMNPDYIAWARRRYGDRFAIEDVTKMATPPGGAFDAILVNSLLHHMDDASSRRLLEHLARLLTDDGHVHILDLVMPERPSLARWMAVSDRGDFPRRLQAWVAMFEEAFEPVVFEPYPLGLAGVTLWNMVYFKGRRKH